MASAKDYEQELARRGLTKMSISASSVAEAKIALAQVRQKQKELRLIKRQVNQEIAQINQYYREQTDAAVKTVGVVGMFAKKRTKSSMRGKQKERLRKKRDKELEPYKQVKLTIDSALVQFDGAKLQLQQFIEQ